MVVVAGADHARVRDRAARAYLEWGFVAFDSRPLFSAGSQVGAARVQSGSTRNVPLVAAGAIAAAMPRGSNRAVSMTIRYDGPLRAPIAKGQHVAELEIAVEGLAPSTVPLLAGEDVQVAGPFDRLINGVAGWFS